MAEHKQVEIDPDKPYEANVISFSGIVYFGVGLFLLIVVTFSLMWVFQYWFLEAEAQKADAENRNPLALDAKDKLPPAPRLQLAPGFEVETKNGTVDLELKDPKTEYKVLLKQWEDEWEHGQKDEKTNTVITLPIKAAKEKLLENGGPKARSAEDSNKTLEEATTIVSASSAGRLASEKRH